jgi:hypothetical protein
MSGLLIKYATDGMGEPRRNLLICIAGQPPRIVASAARLPDETERWLVVPTDLQPADIHRDGAYELVVGEPNARLQMEAIALQQA